MKSLNVPLFVKQVGRDIVPYILNISNVDAENIFKSGLSVEDGKACVLEQFIVLCRSLRSDGLDQPYVDFALAHGLFQFVDGKHIFNVWREKMGGTMEARPSCDRVISVINRMALNLYPLFLIRVDGDMNSVCTMGGDRLMAIYQLPEFDELCNELIKDDVISAVFGGNIEGEKRRVSYANSNGSGGSFDLAGLAKILVENSFKLMRMRGENSLDGFYSSTQFIVDTFRRCVRGEAVDLPVFIEFSNISLDDIGEIETAFGVLRPANEWSSDLSVCNRSNRNVGGKFDSAGFVLECSYPYKLTLGSIDKLPDGFLKVRENLCEVAENISLSFSLACERTPPVGTSAEWLIFLDLICSMVAINMVSTLRSPVKHHALSVSVHPETYSHLNHFMVTQKQVGS